MVYVKEKKTLLAANHSDIKRILVCSLTLISTSKITAKTMSLCLFVAVFLQDESDVSRLPGSESELAVFVLFLERIKGK